MANDPVNDIDKLLAQFADTDADRCWIISQLEESSDPRVMRVFLQTLSNFDEEDTVRIEIMKSFVLRHDADSKRIRVARTLINIVNDDPDELIRQHAANALSLYADVEGVAAVLEQVVRNDAEDLDVRHNALSALITNSSMHHSRAALGRLTAVHGLGKYAQRALSDRAEGDSSDSAPD